MLSTLGTVASPTDTTRSTGQPAGFTYHQCGLWSTTNPGRVVLTWVVTLPTVSLAEVIASRAAASLSPITYGTTAIDVPTAVAGVGIMVPSATTSHRPSALRSSSTRWPPVSVDW